MATSYNTIRVLETFILFCCFCSLVSSDSRDSFIARQISNSVGCSSTGNASDAFRNNVNLLLSDFIEHSSANNYYNTSIGDSSDRVYGYYMCRADVDLKTCSSCILNGTQSVMESTCIEHEDVILFSQLCIFRYTNYSTYGMFEGALSGSDHIDANVSNYQQFNRTLSSTLKNLINETAFGSENNGSRLRFATIEARVTEDETIYSLAQCTPDIAGVNCSRCLQIGVSDFSRSANLSPAAYTLKNKCYIRYDNVSFYDFGDSNVNAGVVLRPSNSLFVYSAVFLASMGYTITLFCITILCLVDKLALCFDDELTKSSLSHPPESFFKTNVGEVSERAYGSYLCRGDLSAKTCSNCLEKVRQAVSDYRIDYVAYEHYYYP
ncbi:cysteine-rich repeat secretory protein 4-like [Chenopodium quinoa]|uniref:cysteine-rich repeat secretory protein 4-like n=1 Tax=Chenopodium quinoa TaxID=63459 RepID=UPI000B793E7E|nr:cysteine-rich repeat secretory protein 4-like [Chenopodium quinoa]